MSESTTVRLGLSEMPPITGNPFALTRSSCLRAVEVARDVSINDQRLQEFAAELDVDEIRNVTSGHMGENCDTLSAEFSDARDAVNFAVLFSLLQFGHGFRHELHEFCGVGASKTMTLGTRRLRAAGVVTGERLANVTANEIRQWFSLPEEPGLEDLSSQLLTVLKQTGKLLERFPAFNDQAVLVDGWRVVLVKKATLAVGEIQRLAAPHDRFYDMSNNLERAVAPIDNVIPAMLVYHRVVRLSPGLHRKIQVDRAPLPRGIQEAELRAVSLTACELIVAAAGHAFSPLDIGYYLWLSGKEPGKRQFPRHHTKDTIFY